MGSEKEKIENISLQLKLDEQEELKSILSHAAELSGSAIARIKCIDKFIIGMDMRLGDGIPISDLEHFFCDYVVAENKKVLIEDVVKEAHFADMLPRLSDKDLRFLLGIPVFLNKEMVIGTLCLFDREPKIVTDLQQKTLGMLARQIELVVEVGTNKRNLLNEMQEKEARTYSLMKIAQLQSHQIRRPLTTIMGLVNLIKEDIHPIDADWINMFEISTNDFDKTIHTIVGESMASKDLKAIRFNKMVEEIDDYAILILDRDGYIENWNKGAERIKGYRFDEIVGQHFSVFYTDEGKKRRRPEQLIKEAVEQGVARNEGWRIRKGGTRFWGSIVLTSIHDNNGDVIGFTKVTRDLTEITQIRDSLIASEELYNMMVEKTRSLARIGGWELDVANNSLSWTSITKEIHGVGMDYIPELTNAISFYKKGESRDKIMRAVQLAIEKGKPWDLELQIVTIQGNEIWVRATGRSNYKDGICTKVYGTFQDINASKGN